MYNFHRLLLCRNVYQVPLDKYNQRPRGFAIIEFIDLPSAELAITNLSGVSVLERELKAVFYTPPKKAKAKVNASNSEEASEDDFDDEFL